MSGAKTKARLRAPSLRPFDPADWLRRAEADGTRFYPFHQRQYDADGNYLGLRMGMFECMADRIQPADYDQDAYLAMWWEFREPGNENAVRDYLHRTRPILDMSAQRARRATE